MRKDTRIPLSDCKNRKPLILNGIEYELDKTKAVGRGGSCLVYHAWQKDTDGLSRRVLLKEFYPLLEGCSGWRQNNGSLCLPTGVETRMERFRDSYERCKELFNEETLNQHIAQVQACPTGNGTIYMVVDYSSGITLNNYEKTCSLLDFFRVMKNLAGILGALHRARSENTKDYVHMDIKPDNILVLPINPAHPEVKELCKLLDTDSFIRKKELRPDSDLSGSRGYTAPEITALAQVLRDPLRGNSARKRFQKVGECSDMYSFGAVIYEYIFDGELPEAPYEICHSYEDRLEKCLQKRFRYIPYKAISLIRNLLKRTLAKDPYDRYETMSEIEAEIGKILKLIDDKKVQLRDNCHRNPDKILGREQKILELRQKLTDPALQEGPGRVVIVTGIGGIGKSSLAREYAAVYAEDYDIKAEVSAASVRDAVDRIYIENDPTEGIQDRDVHFEKKKDVIINLCKEYRILLVVNDYDTLDEPDDIWKNLGCDVILTSRNEWKDMEGVSVVELKSSDLSTETSRNIFFQHYFRHAETKEQAEHIRKKLEKDDHLEKLLGRLDHHPLAIKLMARYMSPIHGKRLTPSQMLEDKSIFEEESPVRIPGGKDGRPYKENAYGHLGYFFRKALDELLKKAKTDENSGKDLEALRYMTLIPSAYGISMSRFEKWTGLKFWSLADLIEKGWVEHHPQKQDLLGENGDQGVYIMPMIIQKTVIKQIELGKAEENVIENIFQYTLDAICSGEKYETRTAATEHLKRLCDVFSEVDEEGVLKSIYQLFNSTLQNSPAAQADALDAVGGLAGSEMAELIDASFSADQEQIKDILIKFDELVPSTDTNWSIAVASNISSICWNNGNFNYSVFFSDRAIKLAQQFPDEMTISDIMSIHYKRGELKRLTGFWEDAEMMFDSAEKIYLENTDASIKGVLLSVYIQTRFEQALLNIQTNKHEKALEILLDTLEKAETYYGNKHYMVGDIANVLADVYSVMNRPRIAVAYREKAFRIKSNLDSNSYTVFLAGDCLLNLSLDLSGWDNDTSAVHHKEAVELLISGLPEVCEDSENLACIYYAWIAHQFENGNIGLGIASLERWIQTAARLFDNGKALADHYCIVSDFLYHCGIYQKQKYYENLAVECLRKSKECSDWSLAKIMDYVDGILPTRSSKLGIKSYYRRIDQIARKYKKKKPVW